MALLMTSLAYGGTWPHSLRQHCIYLVVIGGDGVGARDVGLGMDAGAVEGSGHCPVLLGWAEAAHSFWLTTGQGSDVGWATARKHLAIYPERERVSTNCLWREC